MGYDANSTLKEVVRMLRLEMRDRATYPCLLSEAHDASAPADLRFTLLQPRTADSAEPRSPENRYDKTAHGASPL